MFIHKKRFDEIRFIKPFYIKKNKLFSAIQTYSLMIFKVTGDSNPTLAKYTPLA